MPTQEDRGRAGGLHGLFETVLEGEAGPEVLLIEPGRKAVSIFKALRDLPDDRLVLTVVAQEDVEGLGHEAGLGSSLSGAAPEPASPRR
jgi:hypothetical protein